MTSRISYDHVVSPDELTLTVLSDIFAASSYNSLHQSIDSIHWKPVQAAILSQVFELEIQCSGHDSAETATTTKYLIAKFLKPSLPLSEMFRVEGTFYSQYQNKLTGLIFSTPKCLASGTRFLLLEKVRGIQTYTLLQGCPFQRISSVVRRLARLHRRFWQDSNNNERPLENLSALAGMGSALNGFDKEQLFAQHHSTFPCRDDSDVSLSSSCRDLCHQLDKLQLHVLHERVHAFQPTLIHGDLHVGNLLFSNHEHDNEAVYLIDWATCGAGNPMLDLVFFFIVSTNGVSAQTIKTEWLPLYYKELIATEDGSTINVTQEDLWNHFCHCLVNQFVILVCYDETARQLLAREQATNKDIERDYNRHFDNVNQRCASAILELGGLEELLRPALPSRTAGETDEDSKSSHLQQLEKHVMTEI